MKWLHKDLLDVSQLSKPEVMAIFETAGRFQELQERPVKKVPTLKGRSVVLFFAPRIFLDFVNLMTLAR